MKAKEGLKRVEFAEIEDKSQITAIQQLIPHSHFWEIRLMSVPSVKFPDEWHIMFTRISGQMSLPLKIVSTRSSHLVNKRTELLLQV